MPSTPSCHFRAGDYLYAGQAHDDAIARLDGFDDTAKIVARNSVTELIDLQNGTITCHQVAVIASQPAPPLLLRAVTSQV